MPEIKFRWKDEILFVYSNDVIAHFRNTGSEP